MIVIGGLCVAAAIVAWLYVSDENAVAARVPALDPGSALVADEGVSS